MVNRLIGVGRPGDFLNNMVNDDNNDVQHSKHTNTNQNTEPNGLSELLSLRESVATVSMDLFREVQSSISIVFVVSKVVEDSE